jgi:peptide/nickel transport system permease protein
MKRAGLLLPAIFITLLFAACFSAGLIARIFGVDPNAVDLAARFAPPSLAHILGTDELGRDVFLRLLYGGQISLTVATAAAFSAAVLGTAVGTAAGYVGGRWDAFLMRVTDFLISLPTLPLLIVLSALDLGKLGFGGDLSPRASLYKMAALIALLGWTTMARLVRARVLTIKNMDYVQAARALGAGHLRIILRHILPNAADTVIVAAMLAVGHVILIEAVLSFLGLGIQPPLASWGNMLTGAEEVMWTHARLVVYPGVLVLATVLSFNFLGDALQEWRDPRAAGQGRSIPADR